MSNSSSHNLSSPNAITSPNVLMAAGAVGAMGGGDRPPPEHEFQAGDIVAGRHVVQSFLADSALSTLYTARHASVPSLVYVLKVLKPEFAQYPEIIEQFKIEAISIAQLRDPHTSRLSDMGLLPDGRPFLCREFSRGVNLAVLVKNQGPLDDALVYRIAYDILSSLDEAHQIGIVHRDIRPVTIVLAEDKSSREVMAKIVDFGSAYISARSPRDPNRTQVSNPSLQLYAPQYAAPELLRNKITPAADIYALGLTLAELLDGEAIVPKDAFFLVAQRQLSPDDWALGPNAAKSTLAPILRRAIHKDPSLRFANAGEMLRELRALPRPDGDLAWEPFIALHRSFEHVVGPPVHAPRQLSVPTSTVAYAQIPEEQTLSVILDELPTALRMAPIMANEDVEITGEYTPASADPFAAIDTISEMTPIEGSPLALPDHGLSHDLSQMRPHTAIARRYLHDELVDEHASTDAIRPFRPSRTQAGFDDVQTREVNDEFMAAATPEAPSLQDQDGVPFAAHTTPSLSRDAFTAHFSMDDFVEDAPEAPPLPSPKTAPNRIQGSARHDTPIDALPTVPGPAAHRTVAPGVLPPATTPADEPLEAIQERAKRLRKIEYYQNIALIGRGAAVAFLTVLIAWTLWSAC